MLSLRVVLPLLLVGSGCDTGAERIPVEDFSAAAATATCGWFTRCGGFPDVDSCLGSGFIGTQTLDQLAASAGAGRVLYDGAAARECLDFTDALGCSAQEGGLFASVPPPACGAIWTGQVAEGGGCYTDRECVTEVCAPTPSCELACCLGTCVAAIEAAPIGGACSSSGGCVRGAFCDGVSSTCQLRASVGGPCNSGSSCATGLTCANNVCMPGAVTGESCNPQLGCDRYDDFCNPTTLACERRRPPGAACDATAQCADFAICDASVCVARPGPGDSCNESDDRCLVALTCVDGTCVDTDPPPDPPCQ